MVSSMNRDESIINNHAIAFRIIYHAMLFAIEMADVNMIFFLNGHASNLYRNIKSLHNKDNGEVVPRVLNNIYMISWAALHPLLSTQDIPVLQLRQLIEDAQCTRVNTAPWTTAVDQYEQAKKDAVAADWEQRVSAAEKHARQLLIEVEKEQTELAYLRAQRDRKQTLIRQKGNGLVSRQLESPGAEPEEQEKADTHELHEAEPEWEKLYWAGVKAFSEAGAATALELFQEALDYQPDTLARARIYSAMADCYYVPGEKWVKNMYGHYNDALAFYEQIKQDEQQQQLTLDKKKLNVLARKLTIATEALIEPVRQSVRLHADAIDAIDAIDAVDKLLQLVLIQKL